MALSSSKRVDRGLTNSIKEEIDHVNGVTLDRAISIVELKLRELSKISRSSISVGFPLVRKISVLPQNLDDLAANESAKALRFAKCYAIMDIDNHRLKTRSARANDAVLNAERFEATGGSE